MIRYSLSPHFVRQEQQTESKDGRHIRAVTPAPLEVGVASKMWICLTVTLLLMFVCGNRSPVKTVSSQTLPGFEAVFLDLSPPSQPRSGFEPTGVSNAEDCGLGEDAMME